MASPLGPRRRAWATLLLSLSICPLTPAGVAASAVPGALQFSSYPAEAYLGRPFEIVVAIVDNPQYPQTVVTTGTSATVSLSIDLGPDPAAVLTCANGLSAPTATTGAGSGTATFSGCAFDRVGIYTLKATASSVVSVIAPAPSLADGHSASVRVRTAVEAPQETIRISVSHDGASPWFIWGESATIRVVFTVNGANKPFQLLQTTRSMETWVPLADLVTNASGVATYSYRPSVTTRFRVVFGGSPDLAAGSTELTGFLLFSLARQVPTGSTPKVIRRGTFVTFATTVRPILPDLPPAHVLFRLYHRVSGAWKYVASRYATLDSNGVARTTFKFGARGEWYVRSNAMPRWIGEPETLPAVAWASRPTPIARYSVR